MLVYSSDVLRVAIEGFVVVEIWWEVRGRVKGRVKGAAGERGDLAGPIMTGTLSLVVDAGVLLGPYPSVQKELNKDVCLTLISRPGALFR